MARILVFALIASAAVVVIAAFMRRRSASVVEYEVYPPYPDSELDFDAAYAEEDDGFVAPREDYPPFPARTYN
ncbi:MAG: hypothetical protein ACRDHF_04695 [Tepidiformaceae bacterium]